MNLQIELSEHNANRLQNRVIQQAGQDHRAWRRYWGELITRLCRRVETNSGRVSMVYQPPRRN